MGECKATWWRPCKFQPRFDYECGKDLPPLKVSGMQMEPIIRAMGKETYVKDVCERCGKTIARDT